MILGLKNLINLLQNLQCQTLDLVHFRDWINNKYRIECYAIEDYYDKYKDKILVTIHVRAIQAKQLSETIQLDVKKRYIDSVSFEYLLTNVHVRKIDKFISVFKKWITINNKLHFFNEKVISDSNVEINIKGLYYVENKYRYLLDYVYFEADPIRKKMLKMKYNFCESSFFEYFVATDKERDEFILSQKFHEFKSELYDLYKEYDILNILDFEVLNENITIQSVETAERICGSLRGYLS